MHIFARVQHFKRLAHLPHHVHENAGLVVDMQVFELLTRGKRGDTGSAVGHHDFCCSICVAKAQNARDALHALDSLDDPTDRGFEILESFFPEGLLLN